MQRTRSVKWVSVRVKLIGIYLAVVLAIFLILIIVLPRILQDYTIQRSQDDLLATRQIIQEALDQTQNGGITEAAYAVRDKLDAVAKARNLEIWICLEPMETKSGSVTVPTMRMGGANAQEDISLSAQSAAFIEEIRTGAEEKTIFRDQFPEYYPNKTMTMAYSASYYERQTLGEYYGLTLPVEKTAVVLLNIALSDISNTIHQMLYVVLMLFLILSIVVAILIWMMSNTIIEPVNEMREIAGMISKGDFSNKVTVRSRDEIGDLAESFNKMAEELEQVEETQRAFISNISHDFRSPLTSIRGFVQAILEDVIPPEQHKKYLQIVFDETNRLSKLANDLLILNKMDSGQDVLQLTRFDINEMIRTLVLTFEQRIEEKNLAIDFRFLQEKLFVNADEEMIQRVIYNLVDNAIKFTQQGDSITVETSIVNKKAYISVSDTGVGMDEETQKHIFERFRKGDASRGLNKSGMGLGLAIVKQSIVKHGEDIHVTSKPGEGTNFEFTLPLATQVSFVEKK
ncbi:MAG: HAMP domain-containing histidine kinase [Firmicutes bacterium]|nr:HAMP domain-containing histidine kinase [Bacillota bacterium]